MSSPKRHPKGSKEGGRFKAGAPAAQLPADVDLSQQSVPENDPPDRCIITALSKRLTVKRENGRWVYPQNDLLQNRPLAKKLMPGFIGTRGEALHYVSQISVDMLNDGEILPVREHLDAVSKAVLYCGDALETGWGSYGVFWKSDSQPLRKVWPISMAAFLRTSEMLQEVVKGFPAQTATGETTPKYNFGDGAAPGWFADTVAIEDLFPDEQDMPASEQLWLGADGGLFDRAIVHLSRMPHSETLGHNSYAFAAFPVLAYLLAERGITDPTGSLAADLMEKNASKEHVAAMEKINSLYKRIDNHKSPEITHERGKKFLQIIEDNKDGKCRMLSGVTGLLGISAERLDQGKTLMKTIADWQEQNLRQTEDDLLKRSENHPSS